MFKHKILNFELELNFNLIQEVAILTIIYSKQYKPCSPNDCRNYVEYFSKFAITLGGFDVISSIKISVSHSSRVNVCWHGSVKPLSNKIKTIIPHHSPSIINNIYPSQQKKNEQIKFTIDHV
jgi:hypothetical protein